MKNPEVSRSRKIGIIRSRAILRAAPLGLLLVGAAAAQETVLPTSAIYYQDGVARALVRSSNEFALTVDPARRAEADAGIRALADDLHEPQVDLPSNWRHVRVRPLPAGTNAADVLRRMAGVKVVRPAYRLTPNGAPIFETGDIVVAFKASADGAERAQFATGFGLEAPNPIGGLPDTFVFHVSDTTRDTLAIAAVAHQHAKVAYSHPDFIAPKEPLDVADPLFGQQWHLQNTGQGGGEPQADVNVLPAWDVTLGAGRVIAVLDNGHQTNHPDLAAALVGTFDYTDGDTSVPPESHGTAVSGLALGRANSIGIRGVAPQAGWLAMRYGSDAGIADSFALADSYGAVVHTNSWKYSDPSYLPTVVHNAITNAVTNARQGKGIVVVFAAANDYSPISTKSALAALPETLAVGATTNLNAKADYSNFGAELAVVAPSSGGTLGITSTYPTDSYTSSFGGTSAAAPQVAGAVALILAANPALSAGQVRRILEHTAEPLDSDSSPAPISSGHSNWHGYGRLNAGGAVLAAQTAGAMTWPAAVSNLSVSDQSASVQLSWTTPSEDFAATLLVESRHPIVWAPSDGATYQPGQVVQPGVTVRYLGSSPTFTHFGGPGLHYYAFFATNAANLYSWGAATTGVIAGNTLLSEGFESGASGWTHSGPQDSWAVGVPNYFAGPLAAAAGTAVAATNLAGDYPNGSTSAVAKSAALQSPVLNLPTGHSAYLTFHDWLSVEGGPHDHVRLDVLSPSGMSLATLLDFAQDNHNTWQRQGFDLSPFAGSSVRLEFSLWVDNQHAGPGWYLDEVRVWSALVPAGPGDADHDADVDLADWAQWHSCLSAPGSAAGLMCAANEIDGDGDLDLLDVRAFLNAFSGGP